jgi:hypothetical protein
MCQSDDLLYSVPAFIIQKKELIKEIDPYQQGALLSLFFWF